MKCMCLPQGYLVITFNIFQIEEDKPPAPKPAAAKQAANKPKRGAYNCCSVEFYLYYVVPSIFCLRKEFHVP